MEACGLGGGYVLPLGCSLVSGWCDGGKSESGLGIWWPEALLYGLKVMTDWRWVVLANKWTVTENERVKEG